MIIKSISFKNFRQFRDEKTIDFLNDSSSNNVTVFLGDNSHGKSTLIQAFIWAIYNKEKLDLEYPDDILNKDTLSHLQPRETADVFVKVVLLHGGVEYTFLREQKYLCKDPKVVKRLEDCDKYEIWYVENGQTIRSKEPVATREKILPEDLAGYFFFDGEHIKKLNDKKNLKQSIAKLLGLLPLQNAVRDLEKVYSSIESSLPRGDGNIAAATRKKNEAEAALDSYTTQYNHLDSALQRAKEKFEKSQQALSEYKSVETLIGNKTGLKNKLQFKTQYSNECLIACSKKFNELFINILSSELIAETKEILEEINKESVVSEGIPHMHADSIEYILEKGKCICGMDLSTHPELVEHIRAIGNLLPPHSIGTELAAFNNELDMRSESVDHEIQAFQDCVKSYNDVLLDVDNLQREIDEIDLKLEGVNCSEIEVLRKEYRENEKAVEEYVNNKAAVSADIRRCKADMESARRELQHIMDMDEKYARPRICIKYVERLVKEINDTKLIKESSMLEDFRRVLSDVFNSMYHGEREVIVDDNYNVSLIVPGVGETSISEGTQAVLGFAYVCALLRLALDQLDDPELASEPHSLVMDAPTSTQDDRHIANVFRYTISVTDQIILFINNKDWQYVKPVLEDKIGEVYELNKVSEIVTKVEEAD